MKPEKIITEASKRFNEYTATTVEYKLILQDMLAITGARYGALNVFEEDRSFTTVAIEGIRGNIRRAISMMGFELTGKRWDEDPEREKKIRAHKTTVFHDLTSLTGDRVSPKIVQLLCNTFSIKETVVIKTTKHEQFIGDFTLMFEKGTTLKNQEMAELYADMAGMMLSRIKAEQKILESEKYHRALVKSIPDQYFVINNEGVFLDFKADFRELYVPPEAFIGKHYKEILPAGVTRKFDAAFSKSPDRESVLKISYSLEVADGLNHYEARVVPFGSEKHVVLVRNITEQKASEEAIANSLARLNEAESVGNTGSWEYDISNDKLLWSENLYRIYQLNPDEFNLTFNNVVTLLHPEDWKKVQEAFDNCIKHCADLEIEHRIITPDNEIKYLIERGRAICDDSGKPVKVIGSVADITHRKMAEKELIKLSDLQHLLMNMASKYINISIKDIDESIKQSLAELSEFVHADRAHVMYYDWEKQLARNAYEWINPDIAHLVDELHEIPMGNMDWWVEKHRKGKTIFVTDTFSLPANNPVRTTLQALNIKSLIALPMMQQHQCTGFVGFFSVRQHHDYSEKEKHLLHVFCQILINLNRRAELENMLREEKEVTQAANEELEKINQEKNKMFSVIGHDLKSPFTAILGFSNLLTEAVDQKNYEQLPEYVQIIQNASKASVDLLNNLLNWARTQTGRMGYNPETISAQPFVDEAVQFLAENASQKNISIIQHIPGDAIFYADREMINVVVRNLISNAIKFTAPGGKVTITARMETNNTIFSVHDTGIGIPPSIKKDLFEIGKNTRRSGTQNEASSGLGLILCKEFVDLHGGKILVASEEGIGSTFTVSIPAKPANQQ